MTQGAHRGVGGRCIGAEKENSKVGGVSFLWMCVGGCQGRFPRGCDGCCCRKDLCVVSEGRLDFQPEMSTTGHCQARARAQAISFRCYLILNLSVGSTSEIKVLELREPKIAKLQN